MGDPQQMRTMLTDEMINELEQVTREYVVLCEYNESLFNLRWTAAKLGKGKPDIAEFADTMERVRYLRDRMLMLQQQCLTAIGGKIRIPSGIQRSNIVQFKVEDGQLVFEKPMDAVEFFRLIKTDGDKEQQPKSHE